jgi:uncharacterized membrane protein
MGKGRLEAFSDGVIAIIITIMVLELKVPHGASFNDLLPLHPVLGSYVLSFIYVVIYWNNHHHMLHMVHEVSGMGENHFQTAPVAAYGFVLLMCAIAYTILARSLVANHRENAALAAAIGKDRKGWMSICIYIAGIGLSLLQPWLGFALYIAVAIIWLIPDRRIEYRVRH